MQTSITKSQLATIIYFLAVTVFCQSCQEYAQSKASQRVRSKANYCGIIAMQYVADKLGKPTTLQQLQRLMGTCGPDTSFHQLKTAAEKLGLYARAANINLGTLKSLDCEGILYLPKQRHFVVAGRIDDEYIRLIDLSSNRFYYRHTLECFDSVWDDQALLVDNEPLNVKLDLTELSESDMHNIIAGACPEQCNSKIEDSGESECPSVGGDCGGDHTIYYERWGCGSASSGSCSESSMIGSESESCIWDADLNCSGDGEWTSDSTSACE